MSRGQSSTPQNKRDSTVWQSQALAPLPVSGPAGPTLQWNDVLIGGGGYISGMSFADDGTQAIRTDTYGGYVRRAGGVTWTQVLTTNSMPASAAGLGSVNATGLYEIVIAPNNSSVAYMMPADGYVYKSVNFTSPDLTWARTGFAQISGLSPNATIKEMGRFMAVDPANANVCYVGTPANGVFVTTNGGTTWSAVSAVETATAGNPNLIAFDRHSSVVGGFTQGIYIGTNGSGIYYSGNAGSSWALTNGGSGTMPITTNKLVVDQNGVVWALDQGPGNGSINKYSGGGVAGTWSQVNITSTEGGGVTTQNDTHSIAVDPNNADNIVICNDNSVIGYSIDGLTTFKALMFDETITGDQTWTDQSSVSNVALSISDVQYDPSQNGIAYMGMGYGVIWLEPSIGYSNTPLPDVTLNTQCTGIEQVVSSIVVSMPNGSTICGCEDFAMFLKTSPTLGQNAAASLPAYQESVDGNLAYCYSVDYDPADTSFVMALISGNINESYGHDYSGYSTDAGQTWTQLTTLPTDAGDGGNLAVVSSSKIVWLVGDDSGGSHVPAYSTNGGGSWSAATGAPTQPYLSNPGILPAAKMLCADKVTIGNVYLYAPSNLNSNPNAGFYLSTNSGQSYAKQSSPVEGTHDNFQTVMKVNPGIAEDVWWTAGDGGGPYPDTSRSLWRSANGGASFAAVNGFVEVFCLGFGAAAAGYSHPAIAVVGFYNGGSGSTYTYGIWQSVDNGTTWTNLGNYPAGWFGNPTDIDGDKLVAGRWYIAINGQGFKRYN
jgi:hypothetical protein